ncbi:16S rRNA (guanine(527)-N(7))-methyltransferase RsmG [Sporolactobacillus vineae]|uniref:16S rRNA (guanine(527)-N(7))-methyltransferase RsmG n=1 Tax=Sporolactobacillus vineae TaxID=444463 RepID=UPI00028995E1|nr:16S rRNA (guanine(527)-N(7))-methyltransferase RsmG [Sporolactobacillus vineae]
MELLKKLLSVRNIVLSEQQNRQFNRYYEELIEWNKRINLTGITDENEVAVKHFYDSLTASFDLPFAGPLRVCDVGSGAGFPGIPLKILFPDLKLTIVDSLEKRLKFLDHLTDALDLQQVSLEHERAETFGHRKDAREQFDLVLARAVAPLSVLSEYCLPLVRIGGFLVAMKGLNAAQETADAGQAIEKLGGMVDRTMNLELPYHMGSRTIIIIKKMRPTPARYPRKPGIPARKPL